MRRTFGRHHLKIIDVKFNEEDQNWQALAMPKWLEVIEKKLSNVTAQDMKDIINLKLGRGLGMA